MPRAASKRRLAHCLFSMLSIQRLELAETAIGNTHAFASAASHQVDSGRGSLPDRALWRAVLVVRRHGIARQHSAATNLSLACSTPLSALRSSSEFVAS